MCISLCAFLCAKIRMMYDFRLRKNIPCSWLLYSLSALQLEIQDVDWVAPEKVKRIETKDCSPSDCCHFPKISSKKSSKNPLPAHTHEEETRANNTGWWSCQSLCCDYISIFFMTELNSRAVCQEQKWLLLLEDKMRDTATRNTRRRNKNCTRPPPPRFILSHILILFIRPPLPLLLFVLCVTRHANILNMKHILEFAISWRNKSSCDDVPRAV